MENNVSQANTNSAHEELKVNSEEPKIEKTDMAQKPQVIEFNMNSFSLGKKSKSKAFNKRVFQEQTLTII